MKRRELIAAATAFGTGFAPWAASAQAAYPAKPVKIAVGYAPGGASDILARYLAERLTNEFKQPFIVENMPGASGNIGMEHSSRAEPDGYTLMLGAAAQIAINPSLFRKTLKVNPVTDLTPVSLLQLEHNVMVVPAAVPAKSLTEFITYAMANKNKLSFSSAGAGSPGHLVSELLNIKEDLKMTHAAYKGTGPSVNDVVAGHITMTIDSMTVLLPHIRSGRVRAFCVMSEKRAEAAPDIPTCGEAGRPDLLCTSWKGLFGPKNMSAALQAQLNAACQRILTQKEVRERLIGMGAEPAGGTPEQFTAFVKAEQAKWAEIVRITNASLD